MAETVRVFLNLDECAEPIHFFSFSWVHCRLLSTSAGNYKQGLKLGLPGSALSHFDTFRRLLGTRVNGCLWKPMFTRHEVVMRELESWKRATRRETAPISQLGLKTGDSLLSAVPTHCIEVARVYIDRNRISHSLQCRAGKQAQSPLLTSDRSECAKRTIRTPSSCGSRARAGVLLQRENVVLTATRLCHPLSFK